MNTNPLPFPAAYWVEPGRFLAGEYPGRPDPRLLRQRVMSLLHAGFTTYIDLTRPGEREPYAPTLQEEAGQHGLTISYQRFPIGDFGLPTRSQMSAILEAIQGALDADQKVYLHCWAGVGRTGTTVACYFVQHGMSGEQALARLAELFQGAEQSLFYPSSPETLAQANFVLRWQAPLSRPGERWGQA